MKNQFNAELYCREQKFRFYSVKIIMGSGMSLVMTDIGETIGIVDSMVPGIIIGIIGMLIAIINYPIYKNILSSRKKKYADEIIKLSDKIMRK